MSYTVIDHGAENARVFDERSKAKQKAGGIKQMVDDPSEIEVVEGTYHDYAEYDADDSGTDTIVECAMCGEPVDVASQNAASGSGRKPVHKKCPTDEPQGDPGTPAADAAAPDTPDADDALDQLGESLEDDPLNILPEHMKDSIQGQPAVNKRGYAMIAERYGIAVSARIISMPWDNEEGRAVAHATAETEDGKTYSGHGTACADDGDMEDQLIELAETRALKRAVSWASGTGIVAYEELSDQL